MKISYENRVGTLRRHIKQGTLIRGSFTGEDAKERETACLLAAMSPEVASSEEPDSCPAHVMPGWLAQLTPIIDDNGTDKHWWSMVTRYAEVAALWPVLSKRDWFAVEIRAFEIAISEYKAVMPKELHAWFMGMYSSVEAYSRMRRSLEGRRARRKGPQRPLDRTRARNKVDALMGEWIDGANLPESRRTDNAWEVLDNMLDGLGDVENAWSCAQSSFRVNTSGRMSLDRMTNLLFDAIEAQAKVAREREDIKAVQQSKRPGR